MMDITRKFRTAIRTAATTAVDIGLVTLGVGTTVAGAALKVATTTAQQAREKGQSVMAHRAAKKASEDAYFLVASELKRISDAMAEANRLHEQLFRYVLPGQFLASRLHHASGVLLPIPGYLGSLNDLEHALLRDELPVGFLDRKRMLQSIEAAWREVNEVCDLYTHEMERCRTEWNGGALL